jgi:hypothetical protein
MNNKPIFLVLKEFGIAKRSMVTYLIVFCLGLLWIPGASARPAAPGSESEHVYSISFSLRPELLEAEQSSRAGAFSLVPFGGENAKENSGSPSADTGPKKKTLRAWLELGTFLTYSTISYWIRSAFPEDWQFRLTFDTQMKRFFLFEGWRFDSNAFVTNWTHSPAGAIYYQFSRTNNLSWLQSWLTAVIASTYWEGFVEWKEVISLNDQILTGLGGYAVGEPWYQLGRYLNSRSNVILNALGFINPINKLNQWLDRKDSATWNYAQPGWHGFNLFSGIRSLSSAGQATQTGAYFGLDDQIMELPEYGKPGQVSETVKDTYFSQFCIDYTRRAGHADETNITAEARSWGYVRQDINANREGYSLSIGLGSSFEYFKKRPLDYYDINAVPVDQPVEVLDLERPRAFTDKLALLHIAGPVLDWTIFRRGLKLRSVTAAYFDFGLINSFALNEYSALHDITGMKTTVMYYGYYYGFGGSFSEKADLEWGNFRVRGQASFMAWGSADFRDRFPDRVINNAHLGDDRTRWLLGAGWKVPHAPLAVFLNLEDIYRWGKIQEVRVHALEKRAFAGLEFTF